MIGGQVLVDSSTAVLLFEDGATPTYLVSLDAVDQRGLVRSDVTGRAWDLHLPRGVVPSVVREITTEAAGSERLVAVDWEAMDAWYEEDELMFGHPRDPYRRVDVFASSRHVMWRAGGVLIAESNRPLMVAETGMPARWYLPAEDVELGSLTLSDTVTRCPYKGRATHYSVSLEGSDHPDAVWTYATPLPESSRLAGHLGADPARVHVVVDGSVLEPEPFHARWLNPSLWL